MTKKKKSEPINNQNVSDEEVMYELFSLTDYITQYGAGASLGDFNLKQIYDYLKNPYRNIKFVVSACKYYTNKYGLVKDIYKALSNLPTYNYHLAWSSLDDVKKVKKYEKKVYEFLDTINPAKMVRDGIYEQAEVGVVVTCNRNNKYIQFLEIDDLRINRMENGRWVVEYDFDTLKKMKVEDAYAIIESLPDDITNAKFDAYKKGEPNSRYVKINNCNVLPFFANRNMPRGLPMVFPALPALIQKDLIDKLERSNVDVAIKKILILYAGSIAGKDSRDGYKPPARPVIEHYFGEIKKLLQQRSNETDKVDTSGIGAITLPDYFNLKPLDVDIKYLSKEVYSKIENDIFASMGFPKSLVFGAGDSNAFGTESIAVQKVFRYISHLLEDWEDVINEYIKQIVPVGLTCKFYFDKTTILDKDKDIEAKQTFYTQTGIWIPWAEAVLGVPYHYALGMKEYQDKILDLESIIRPPINPFTQTGDEPAGGNKGNKGNKGGRPEAKTKTDGNLKNKGSKGNAMPSPSD